MTAFLIVGAGSGVGAEVARRIARPGARMLLHTGRNRERLETVAEACRDSGAEVASCLGDMAEEASFAGIRDWLDETPDGGLDGLVFAAGYAKIGELGEAPPEALETALRAMPLAFHRLMTTAAPKFAPGRGRAVCVSAFGAHISRPRSYAATGPAKAALEAQARIFAASLAPRGVTVNAVVPGFIEKEPGTPSSMTPAQWAGVAAEIPMGRIGRRGEVAALIAFLLSEEAGYVTGQAIHANGGLTL